MGAELSTEQTEEQQQEAAATKLQAITRGRKARQMNPLSSADYKGDEGSETMRIQIVRKKSGLISRRPGKLGIELDPDNRIVSLLPPANASDLKVGDFILEVDGFPLGEDMLIAVIEKNGLKGPAHEMRIRRLKAA